MDLGGEGGLVDIIVDVGINPERNEKKKVEREEISRSGKNGTYI